MAGLHTLWLGSALPIIEENRIANLLLAGTGVLAVTSLTAASLDWNEPISACKALQDLGRVDLIMWVIFSYLVIEPLGSDCLFMSILE